MKKTNRTFKRFAAITSASLLAACMVAPMAGGFTSSAAEAGKITFTTSSTEDTNTYRAYRIFTGTAVNNGFGGSAMMSNIQWDMAEDNATEFLEALKNDARFKTDNVSDFASCQTAEDVAAKLTNYAKAKEFAEFVVEHADLLKTSADSADGVITLSGDTNDGYYVIAQTSHVGVTTSYILGVYDASAGAEVEVKTAAPSFEKLVMDENDSYSDETNAWQKSADYDIGDMVPFKLVATLPDDYSTYNEYKIVFHDKLDDGFTYISAGEGYTAPQLIVNDSVVENAVITTNVSPTHDATKCNLEFTIDDVKQYTGAATSGTVEVIFYAKLDDDAKIGSEGNWNNAYMEYSNNPYYTSGNGNDTDNGKDGIDNDGDGQIDEADEAAGETTDVSTPDNVAVYTYQTIINKVDGTNNNAELKGAVFELFKKNGEGVYVSVEKLGVDENGINTNISTFTFKGLDDGLYKLVEVSTPSAEYNKIADIEFEITADHTSGTDGKPLMKLMGINSEGEVTLQGLQKGNVKVSDGSITATIQNNKGNTLPGTGGIGTTIFYLGGGAMAAIGGIYLISKRRMKKSEE